MANQGVGTGDAAAAAAGAGATSQVVGTLHRFENVEFDEAQNLLKVAGELVTLEPRPLQVLAELLRRVNEVVTKDELIENVWDGRTTVDHVLPNAISKLRSALGEAGAARIVTLPRVGYRLQGPVQRIETGTTQHLLQAGQEVPGRPGYVLERPLGQGARHDVWLATHNKLGQSHVFKFADDGARLTGLKREYTLYRVLKQELGPRDDFATVLDTNFVSAPYFLECEYGGISLTEWATQTNADGAPRLAAMSQEERLNLFLQFAGAVAAAHSVGVLHKDIKPGNILISGTPEKWQARLTDFGSGRLLDASRLAELKLTALGMTQTLEASSDSRSGTLMYMAPEVMAGQAPTVQSDVYALGVVLYQMLVGDFRRPMATGWEREIGDELLRGDIAAATEGLSSTRLANAAALVDRLSRLSARLDEAATRLRNEIAAEVLTKQLQRAQARRPFVIAAIAALSIGLAVSLIFYKRAENASRLAEGEANRAKAINEFLNKDVLQSADVNRAANVKEISMQDVLDRASARASERFKGQPGTEASVRQQLGEIFFRLAAPNRAEKEFSQVILLLEGRVAPNHPELLSARFGVVRAMSVNEKSAAAEPILLEAEKASGAALLAGKTELALAALRARLDWMLARQQNKEAIPFAKRLVELSNGRVGADMIDQFESKQRLGEVYLRLEDKTNADAVIGELMKPPFDAQNVGEVTFARGRMDLAKALILQSTEETTKRAEQILLEVRNTLTSALGPKALQVGHVNYILADIHAATLRSDLAEQELEAARVAFAASLGEQHGYTVSIATNQALTDLLRGRANQALKAFDALMPWYVKRGGGDDQGIAFHRASALADLGRFAEAVPAFDKVDLAKLASLSWGADDWRWRLQGERGRMLMAQGKRPEGLKLIQEALLEMEKLSSAESTVARYRRFANGEVGNATPRAN